MNDLLMAIMDKRQVASLIRSAADIGMAVSSAWLSPQQKQHGQPSRLVTDQTDMAVLYFVFAY